MRKTTPEGKKLPRRKESKRGCRRLKEHTREKQEEGYKKISTVAEIVKLKRMPDGDGKAL